MAVSHILTVQLSKQLIIELRKHISSGDCIIFIDVISAIKCVPACSASSTFQMCFMHVGEMERCVERP